MLALSNLWHCTILPRLASLWWLFRIAFVLVGVFAVASWLWFEILTSISVSMGMLR